jgi:prepilin-type N-terminal cleavage/methylation domain-containing protein
MTPLKQVAPSRDGERGFTLIETLVAIVILVFGLMAVTNLLLIGATNNTVANQGTAAAAIASQRMEQIKQIPFVQLTSGTTIDPPQVVPGVGTIQTTVVIGRSTTDCQVRWVTVTSEGTGAMARVRSRASYTTFRTCTSLGASCPPISGPCNP